MGSSLSRTAGKAGRSLPTADVGNRKAPMTVKLTEKALKPEPRGKDSGALSQHLSEYILPEEMKDHNLDVMLTTLGDSLTQHRVSLYDQQALKAARTKHAEQRRNVDGRLEPRIVAEAFQQYYKEREARGEAAIAEIAARHRVDPVLLERLVRTTCLPAVRNESVVSSSRDGPHVRMHAEWR